MTPPENASFAVPLKRLPDVFRGQNGGKKYIYIYQKRSMTLNFLPMKLMKAIYKACSPAMKAIAIKLLFNLTVKLSCQGQMQFICSFQSTYKLCLCRHGQKWILLIVQNFLHVQIFLWPQHQEASSLNQVRNFRPSGLNRASSQMETKTEVGSRNSLLPSLFSVVSAFHFDGHFTVVIIIALCNSRPNFLKTMSHMLFIFWCRTIHSWSYRFCVVCFS